MQGGRTFFNILLFSRWKTDVWLFSSLSDTMSILKQLAPNKFEFMPGQSNFSKMFHLMCSKNFIEKLLKSFSCFRHHVNFKASFVKQLLIYAKQKQLFEHLLQKCRRWPLLGTVVHPSALLLPGNVSDLSDLRQFYFSVILSEFGARPRWKHFK